MQKLLKITLCSILALGLTVTVSGCPSPATTTMPEKPLPRFGSAEEFVNAFTNALHGYGTNRSGSLKAAQGDVEALGESSETPQHSTTNVQVEGVDEADVVKTDGVFIYTIAGNSLCIVGAYPPEKMRLLSRIDFDDSTSVAEMFVNGNRLVAMGYGYAERQDIPVEQREYYPGRQLSFIKVYDISKRAEPRLLNTIEHEGSYLTSRMVGENVYAVLTSWPYAVYDDDDPRPEELIPMYRATPGGEEPGALAPACDWSEVEYINPEACSNFLSILSLSLEDNGSSVEKREIAGNAENVYASAENLYVTAADYWAYPLMGGGETDDSIDTTIHKFRLGDASVAYLASAEVPGTVLNQFSMDEWNGYFRVATTIGHVTREGSVSTNNVYVLDPALNIAGRLEGLAPGETIYSARFVGSRGYLVTFEKIDPFFVLDLANPASPKMLGELKIPGYSDYLHPYDETHIIGVGKNALEADPSEGNFSWYQGMKIALFDVSNVFSPQEMYKVEIGDRGTDSYALYDHKAFLFDRDKELLVLPIMLAELTPEQKASPDAQAFDYGEFTFQGAYVYDLSLAGGFDLKGRITHIGDPSQLSGDYYDYYYGSEDFVARSLLIEDTLYTISQSGIKANDLGSLDEKGYVGLTQP